MDRLSEITFLLPETAESRGFLGELRSLLAEVAYADFAVPASASAGTAGRARDRLTLTPPQPADARPVTAFQLADVLAPEVVLDTGHSISLCGGETPDALPSQATVEMADLTRRLAGHVKS